MAAPKQFSFPILPVGEISACIQEMTGTTTRDSDIQKPQPEMIIRLLEQIIEGFTGTSVQELRQPSFEQLNSLGDQSDIYVDALGQFKFFRIVQKLMLSVGVRDFTTADLYKPQEKRTIRNFSALINFAKFREERIGTYAELSAKSEALMQQRNKEEEDLQTAQATLRQYRQQREKEEPQIKQLEEEASKLEGDVRQLNKVQLARQNEGHELKERNAKINDQITSYKLQLNQIRQEIGRLQTLIVRSPEKIKKMLEDMAIQLEKEKAAAAEADVTYETLLARFQRLLKIEKGTQKCIALMSECDAEMEKLKKVTKEIKEKKSEIKQFEQELQQLAASEKNTLSRIESTQTKTVKLAQQYGARKAEAEESLAETRKELQDIENARMVNRGKIDQNTLLTMQIQQQIDRMRAEHEAEMAATKQKCDKLVNEVHEYNSKVRAAMRTAPTQPAIPSM